MPKKGRRSTYEYNAEAVLIIQQPCGMTVVREFGELTSVSRTNMAAGSTFFTVSAEQFQHLFTEVVSKHVLQLDTHTHSSKMQLDVCHLGWGGAIW